MNIQKKYEIDDNYFDKIDSEDKAYFLGLLLADGHNRKNDNGIEIKLQERDYNILVLLQKYIKSTAPIVFLEDPKQYRLIFYSKHMSDQLNRLGLSNHKYQLSDLYGTISNNLMNHFLRGFIDGDGGFSNKNRSGGYISPVFYVIAHISFLIEIQKILMKECNLPKVSFRQEGNNDMATLTYQGFKEVIRIRNYLYKDATIYLIRKYDFIHMFEYKLKGSELLLIQREDVIRDYVENKISAQDIGEKYGCDDCTVFKFLKENNVYIRTRSEALISVIEENKSEVIKLYSNGMSTEKIALKFGVTGPIVRKFLKRWNISKQDFSINKDEIVDMYSKGISTRTIAEKFNTNKTTLSKHLREWDITLRVGNTRNKLNE